MKKPINMECRFDPSATFPWGLLEQDRAANTWSGRWYRTRRAVEAAAFARTNRGEAFAVARRHRGYA